MGGPSGGPSADPGMTSHMLTQSNEYLAPPSASELRDQRAAFALARMPMALVDREGRVLEANEALGALLGSAPSRLTTRTAAPLLGLDTEDTSRAAYRDVLIGRRDLLRCTRRIRRRDGALLWAEVTAVRLDERVGGSGRTVLVSVEDIGER